MAQAARDQNRVTTILGVDEATFTIPTTVAVTADHEMLIAGNIGGLDLPNYDYVSMALSAADTTETYTFKTGGAGGATVATVVVVYTTSDRDILVSATKTLP